MSRRGGWSARVVALSAWRSVAPLHRTPVSKSSLCAYPRVLPCLRRITATDRQGVAALEPKGMGSAVIVPNGTAVPPSQLASFLVFCQESTDSFVSISHDEVATDG